MVRSSSDGRGGRNRLKLALYIAINELREADGRASGLKFNKLMYKLFGEFKDTHFRFDLPYRWYLYGAVVDDVEVRSWVSFDHPEDEFMTNVTWRGQVPSPKGDDEEAYSEFLTTASDFARRYPLSGTTGRWEMLRDHYEHAPEPFQRGFLEWEIFTQQVIGGHRFEEKGEAQRSLRRLVRTYPVEIEPRLTPAFHRLSNVVEHKLSSRHPNERAILDECKQWLWDFWNVFCDFLSLDYNNAITEGRLESYRYHAEEELVAYKRNLQRLLEEFWTEHPTVDADEERLEGLKASLLEDINRAL